MNGVSLKSEGDKLIAEVCFIKFIMAMPDDSPLMDEPIEQVKSGYEDFLKRKENVDEVRWV